MKWIGFLQDSKKFNFMAQHVTFFFLCVSNYVVKVYLHVFLTQNLLL